MQIKVVSYHPDWKESFGNIKRDLKDILVDVRPQIEHIGSTSVEGLSAKPIIDLLVGVKKESDLDKVVEPMIANGYIYYEIYNPDMPYRRFFVKHRAAAGDLCVPSVIKKDREVPRSTEEHDQRLSHIHVMPVDSVHWLRHIAFRDYLKAHPIVKRAYQELKEGLRQHDWHDGNDYNKAKDAFLKTEEKNALEWYKDQWVPNP